MGGIGCERNFAVRMLKSVVSPGTAVEVFKKNVRKDSIHSTDISQFLLNPELSVLRMEYVSAQ